MKILFTVLLLYACSAAHAEEFYAKVIAVMDGDTVLVLRGAQKIKIRLANIDAPEKGQNFGMESRQTLFDRVSRKQVFVNSRAVDSYGRTVAEISVDGHSVNEEQVRRGMAWEYSHFHADKHYIALQYEAQQAHLGLWMQANPTPPWEWRKTHSVPVPKQAVAAQNFVCGSKRRCAQMRSCDEAYYYLTHCGAKSLDGNGDGVPCENLCAITDKLR